MTEPQKAKTWRERNRLSVAALAELTGYSIETIYLMERGISPSRGKIQPWVWMRYRRACQGVDATLRTGREFNWGG